MSSLRNKTIKGSLILSVAGLCLLEPPIASGKVETHFNSTERLEKYVKGAFSAAVTKAKKGKPGTIDIMIFSFTSNNLADSLLRIARDFPNVKIRMIGNLSQLFREPTSVIPEMEDISSGKPDAYRRAAERRKYYINNPEEKKLAVEGEYKQIVSEFRRKPLPNIEIKYKWFPAFSWNEEKGKADYDHFHPKAALLHHKSAVVNGELLVTGSYNWSNYAETKNLENVMIVSGPEDQKLVTDFEAEFEAMWNDPNLTKTSAECKALKDKICAEIDRQHKNSP